jgi:hypothetical protein
MVSILNTRAIALAIFVAISRCAVAHEGVPAQATANIEHYVSAHYGWNRRVYRIERHRDEDGYAVFWVVHRDDAKNYNQTGGGKSFVVLCDRRTFKIVKELWFQ